MGVIIVKVVVRVKCGEVVQARLGLKAQTASALLPNLLNHFLQNGG